MREKLRGFFCPGKTSQEKVTSLPPKVEFENRIVKFK